jgi:hypothetical protein
MTSNGSNGTKRPSRIEIASHPRSKYPDTVTTPDHTAVLREAVAAGKYAFLNGDEPHPPLGEYLDNIGVSYGGREL